MDGRRAIFGGRNKMRCGDVAKKIVGAECCDLFGVDKGKVTP